jgi:hypothetical protein
LLGGKGQGDKNTVCWSLLVCLALNQMALDKAGVIKLTSEPATIGYLPVICRLHPTAKPESSRPTFPW